MPDLDNRVAIVTGAGMGIGRASALALARAGAAVAIADIDQAAGEKTRAEVEAAGGTALFVRTDVASFADAEAATAATVAAFGRVDILVNNAGINDNFLPAHAVDDATWDRVMTVNVRGPLLLCRRVLPGMVERHAGAIINVASVGGLKGGTSGVAYTASKHALVGMSRSIAWYYASDGIRCNAVQPGLMDTPLVRRLADKYAEGDFEGFSAHRNRQVPMGHMGDAWDVAHAALFLASDEAKYVTATELVVDGGLTAATR